MRAHPAAARVGARVVAAIRDYAPLGLLALDEGLVRDAVTDGLWQVLVLGGALAVVPLAAEGLSYEVPSDYGMLSRPSGAAQHSAPARRHRAGDAGCSTRPSAAGAGESYGDLHQVPGDAGVNRDRGHVVWACVSSVDTEILGATILGEESTMAKTHPPYPAAFRAEAVELARASGKGIPRLASELGVSEQALRGWVKRAEADAGRGQPGELTTEEREELRRLRRENHVLKQERD